MTGPASSPQSPSRHATTVPRPASRWFLRFVLPIMIVMLTAGILAYVARDAFVPTVEVDVVPVVAKAADARDAASGSDGDDGERPQPHRGEPVIIAQAPGWIEPDPYAVTVQSLISGVVEEVHVLEGDHVKRGQIIARLIADEAELAVRRAQAELAELRASVERAKAELDSAQALLRELDDEVDRKRELVGAGGISPGEFARLEHRQQSQRSAVDAARAAIRQREAAVERQQVAVEEAELMLERTVIRAPMDGVVMSRSVVPGTRIAIAGDGPGEQHFPGVARLYEPSQLQVRADVPLTDAGKVGIGTRAHITTEAAPNRTFHGEVTRIVHRADIQRNTVQVKVRIDEPNSLLKPDMLTRVRFLSAGETSIAGQDADPATGNAEKAGSLRLYIEERAVINRNGDRADVWVVEPGRDGRSSRAVRREITLGDRDGEMVLVRSGLRPGDRLIVNPPDSLASGTRVRLRPIAVAQQTEQEAP